MKTIKLPNNITITCPDGWRVETFKHKKYGSITDNIFITLEEIQE